MHISSPALINISKPLTGEQTATALQDLLSRRRSKALTSAATHSSALPTRFSPLLLEFKHNLHRAQGLMALQKEWQHENRARFTSLHPPRNPDKSFV